MKNLATNEGDSSPGQNLAKFSIKGKAAYGEGEELKDFEYDEEVGANDVVVDIEYSGICHSDIHLIDNDWKVSKYPFIPGHEIVGKVSRVGDDVTEVEVGDLVGIGWQADSCGNCGLCSSENENLCQKNKVATCVQRNGGFAHQVVANERFAIKLPEGLDPARTAPMLCGGITMFSPLAEHPNPEKVGVVGIGGLGHLGVKFASAMGAEVVAFSTSPDKEQEALDMGADRFVTDPSEVVNELDLILNTVPGSIDYDVYLSALRPYGSFCQLGATNDSIEVNRYPLVAEKKCVTGSNTGSPAMIRRMFEFAAEHDIGADIEVFDLDNVNEAIQKVRDGEVHYRAVLKV